MVVNSRLKKNDIKKGDVGEKWREAVALYRQSCQLGDGEGCDRAGFILYQRSGEGNGSVGRKLLKEAQTLFQKGCRLGYGWSCLHLAYSYQYPSSPKVAQFQLSLYRRGCRLGVAQGCLDAGDSYRWGEGVGRNLSEALFYYQLGCRIGKGEECLRLGEFREERGEFQKALSLYTRLCRQKVREGCFRAARLFSRHHRKGEGVEYYRKAAQLGDWRAKQILEKAGGKAD